MSFLIAIFARWGLPEQVRKPLAYATAILAALALLWAAKALYDRSVIADHEAKQQAEAIEARDRAADARAADAIVNAQTEKELHDAINAAPTGGSLSPAARALACERLRNVGRIPTACRSDGGD